MVKIKLPHRAFNQMRLSVIRFKPLNIPHFNLIRGKHFLMHLFREDHWNCQQSQITDTMTFLEELIKNHLRIGDEVLAIHLVSLLKLFLRDDIFSITVRPW